VHKVNGYIPDRRFIVALTWKKNILIEIKYENVFLTEFRGIVKLGTTWLARVETIVERCLDRIERFTLHFQRFLSVINSIVLFNFH